MFFGKAEDALPWDPNPNALGSRTHNEFKSCTLNWGDDRVMNYLPMRSWRGARALQHDSKDFTQLPTQFWAVQLQSWDYVNFWEYIDTISSIVPCQHILIMRPHGIATAELARDLVVWIPDSVCSMQNEESISKSYLPSQRFLLLDPRLGTRSPRWCGSRWIIPKLRPRTKKLVTLEGSWHIHWYQSFGENLSRQL